MKNQEISKKSRTLSKSIFDATQTPLFPEKLCFCWLIIGVYNPF